MKMIELISLFLGVSMFMVGFLKFFNPFKSWYATQITTSGLGSTAYWIGISGEIVVGLLFVLLLIIKNRMPAKLFYTAIAGCSGVVSVIMVVGFYVHLHPDVPGEVLPLKVKPPVIPGVFLLLAVFNILVVRRLIAKAV